MFSLKILTATVAVATFSLAFAQGTPPRPATDPAVGAGQRSTPTTPLGSTGTPGGGGAPMQGGTSAAGAGPGTAGTAAGSGTAGASGSMNSGASAGATGAGGGTAMAADTHKSGTKAKKARKVAKADRN
jgi:hypothetical protein